MIKNLTDYFTVAGLQIASWILVLVDDFAQIDSENVRSGSSKCSRTNDIIAVPILAPGTSLDIVMTDLVRPFPSRTWLDSLVFFLPTLNTRLTNPPCLHGIST